MLGSIKWDAGSVLLLFCWIGVTVPLKISLRQRLALHVASSAAASDALEAGTGGVHIGKRTWEALQKKGLVTQKPETGERWHLTHKGWNILKSEWMRMNVDD